MTKKSVGKERKLEHRAQEDAIHQLQTQSLINSEDEMKMDGKNFIFFLSEEK